MLRRFVQTTLRRQRFRLPHQLSAAAGTTGRKIKDVVRRASGGQRGQIPVDCSARVTPGVPHWLIALTAVRGGGRSSLMTPSASSPPLIGVIRRHRSERQRPESQSRDARKYQYGTQTEERCTKWGGLMREFGLQTSITWAEKECLRISDLLASSQFEPGYISEPS